MSFAGTFFWAAKPEGLTNAFEIQNNMSKRTKSRGNYERSVCS